MIKKYKGTLIFTSLTMLLPILVGLLLWDKLPEQVPYHWGINGDVDGWANKTQAVFLMPCLMLVLHWVCVLASCADPKRGNYNNKSFLLVLWICPAITLLICSLMYAKALGYDLDVNVIMPLLFGTMFLIIGNLLPKMRQSYTLGIKLPWTLHNEENWKKTHRFSGKVWFTGAIVILATAFLGSFWILLGVLIVMVALPTIYSYCLYRKQVREETE
jgi:uncharacterized membrane protein